MRAHTLIHDILLSSAQFGKHGDQFDADKDRQLMELEAAHLRTEQRCADYERALRSLAQLANEQVGGGIAVRPESPMLARSASPVRDAERTLRQALVQMPFILTVSVISRYLRWGNTFPATNGRNRAVENGAQVAHGQVRSIIAGARRRDD